MKKLLLLLSIISIVFASDKGAWQSGGVDRGAWQGGAATATTLTLIVKSKTSTITGYTVICSLYTDTGAIGRFQDSSSAATWTQRDSTGWKGNGGYLDTFSRTGLTSNTMYYFRFMGEDSSGFMDTTARDSIRTKPELPIIAYTASICTTDIAFSRSVSSTGGPTDSIVCTATLPEGLSCNKTTGTISGTCTRIVPLPGTDYQVIAYNASGNDTAQFQLTTRVNTQIWVDHRHIARWDKIPIRWLDSAKTKLLNIPGASHGTAYVYGLNAVKDIDANYSRDTIWTGEPSAGDGDLRVARTYKTGASTWTTTCGEQEFWTNATAIATMQKHLRYMSDTANNPVHALIFGHSYEFSSGSATATTDPVYKCHWYGNSIGSPSGDAAWGIDADDYTITSNDVSMQTYCDAIEVYDTIDSRTRAVYSTGPEDNYPDAEQGYQRYIKNQHIRSQARANVNRVMLDQADILNYGLDGNIYIDPDGWTDGEAMKHTYPSYDPDYAGSFDGGHGTCHVDSLAGLQLGKALWFLAARLSGWNGYDSTNTLDKIAITVDPVSTRRLAGEGVTFTVTATGSSPAYQWKKNGSNVGTNSSSYTIDPVAIADSGATVYCIVSNDSNSDTSATATLIVKQVPQISVQPTSQTEDDFTAFSFGVTASRVGSYQWYKAGTPTSILSTYSGTAAYVDSFAKVWCRLTNDTGTVTTDTVRLHVTPVKPSITLDPVSSRTRVGGNITFTAATTGTATITQRWQENNVDIESATETSYTKTNCQQSDSGKVYRCIFSNFVGDDTTSSAVLRVGNFGRSNETIIKQFIMGD